jgi:uncharacterized protein (DUF608 family)
VYSDLRCHQDKEDIEADTWKAYHLWAIIGTYNHFLYTEDVEFLEETWPRYVKAMDYTYSKMTSAGIFNATSQGDWGRWKYSTLASSVNVL